MCIAGYHLFDRTLAVEHGRENDGHESNVVTRKWLSSAVIATKSNKVYVRKLMGL
jgi:hypothetical protein